MNDGASDSWEFDSEIVEGTAADDGASKRASTARPLTPPVSLGNRLASGWKTIARPRVTSARWIPLIRRAGNPTKAPAMPAVMTPKMIARTHGSDRSST